MYNETREKHSDVRMIQRREVYGLLDSSSANLISGGDGCTLHSPS